MVQLAKLSKAKKIILNLAQSLTQRLSFNIKPSAEKYAKINIKYPPPMRLVKVLKQHLESLINNSPLQIFDYFFPHHLK